MATARELLTVALEGGTPDRTPYSMYSWIMDRKEEKGKEAWSRVLDQGLGLSHHCSTVRHVEHGVQDSVREEKKGPDTFTITTKSCPAGEIRMVRRNGWHYEDWIKTPEDYKVRQWMIEHTELVTQYEEYDKADAWVGSRGLPIVTGSRTPAMSLNVDWAGTLRFCTDVALEVPELFDLYEAQKKLFLEETRLISRGPGRFVKWFENLTVSMLGPDRYRTLLLPVYREAVPMLEQGGKRVMVHYDGALGAVKDLVAESPYHMVESLTEAPEGDMSYRECRAKWPDKVLYGNINVALYYRPVEELKRAVAEKRERAGKRGFAFEISEDLPKGWEQSVPAVLETLEEIG